MIYTGARILVESLIKNGVDTIFGYPGGAVLDIYDELYKCKDRIRHILVSHEQHAAHAADGYARSTGRAGVCLATSGPGATNLVTGIATAFVDSVPVIAVTGNVGTPLLGKDSFQEVDIAGITMPIVKHNWIVEDVNDLAEIVNEAFVVALSGRPGPVLIDIPKDIIGAVCREQMTDNREKTHSLILNERAARLIGKTKRETFNNADIEKAAALIKNSKRPMIFAGGGVINSGAGEQLTQLAERLIAPVALSLMGMGAINYRHPLYTGMIGMHGTIASNKAVQKADLLIAAGVRFSDRVTNGIGAGGAERFAKNAKIIHIDIDPAEINKNINTETFIIGDIKEVLNKLMDRIPCFSQNEWGIELQDWKNKYRNGITDNAVSGKKTLHPLTIVEYAAGALGENTIAVTDVGQHQIWTAQFFPFTKTRTFLSSGGMGTMGYGMGAAAGAKIANPSSPVVLFTGDGCFRMNSGELATLVKYKLPVLIVVFNNSTLGMLRQWQNFIYSSNYYETDLDNSCPDFIKLAAAYNVEGFRVTDGESLSEALKKCVKILAEGKPALVEAVISRDEKVEPMRLGAKPVD